MSFLKNISPDQVTDRELVTAFKESGELTYLSTLYQRYMDLVFGVCFKYLKDTELSKDAVMDIFEDLNTKLRHHEVDNFRGWLHVVARNHCLMQLRSPRNLKTTEFKPEVMQSGQAVHLKNEYLEKEENYQQLENCIQKLPAEQKQNIEMFYLQKKCYKEIAAITGYDLNKVRSYIQNGKRNLKICMENKMTETGGQKINIFK